MKILKCKIFVDNKKEVLLNKGIFRNIRIYATNSCAEYKYSSDHSLGSINHNTTTMSFVLPELPYAKDALAPHISEETLNFHYGAHHKTYVTNLNNLVKGKFFFC